MASVVEDVGASWLVSVGSATVADHPLNLSTLRREVKQSLADCGA
jgi:hypothetical protein